LPDSLGSLNEEKELAFALHASRGLIRARNRSPRIVEGRVSNFLNTHVKKMNQNKVTALPIDTRGLFTVPESGKAYQTETTRKK
jgi:hypothetical protein